MARVKRPTKTVPDITSARRNEPPRKSPPHKKRLTKEERIKARKARQERRERRAREEEERKQYIAEKYGNGVYSKEIDNYKHSGQSNDDSSSLSDPTTRPVSVNTEGQFYYHEFIQRGELVSNNDPWFVHTHDDHPYQILRSYRREHDGVQIANGEERGESGFFVRRPDGVLQPVLKCKIAFCRYCCDMDLQEENMDYIPHIGGKKRKKARMWYPEHWINKKNRPLHPPYDPSNVSAGGELSEWSQKQDDGYRMKLHEIKHEAKDGGKIWRWLRDVKSGSPEAQPPYVDLTSQHDDDGEKSAKEGHDTQDTLHPQNTADGTEQAENLGQSQEGPKQKNVKQDGHGDVEMDDADANAVSTEQATEAEADKDTSSNYHPNTRLQDSMKNLNHTYQTRLAKLR